MHALDTKTVFPHNSPELVIGCNGEIHSSVHSTMDVAKEKAQKGAPDGYVVLAEQQTSGRGRNGSWECSTGKGLLFTVILHADLPLKDRHLVGLLGPLAATEVFRNMGVNAWIKWPNDVVTVKATSPLVLQKLGGTLVEQSQGEAGATTHLLGLGLNINQQKADLGDIPNTIATSVRIERDGQPVDRNDLCRDLFGNLDKWYRSIRLKDYNSILKRWRELNCLRGKKIRVRSRKRVITGKVVEMRISGELIVQSTDNQTHRLSPDNTTVLSDPAGDD